MFGAVGLRTYIWNNFWKSALLLAGFPLLLGLFAWGIALMLASGEGGFDAGLATSIQILPRLGAIIAAITGIWFLVAWVANQRIIDWASGARAVTRKEEPRLWNLLENLCIARGLRMPRLAIIESPARNAFASGLGQPGAVTVTRGLLQALEDREIAAVLAHELSHIRNGDARVAVIAAVFTGIITLIPDMLLRGLRISTAQGGSGWPRPLPAPRRQDDDNRDGGRQGGTIALLLLGLAVILVSAGLAVLLRLALSRNREFIADAGSVELTQDPDAMITALRKLAGHSAMPELPGQIQAMLVDDPTGQHGPGWLATHPPLDQRIAMLVRYGGGRDPGPLPPPRMEAPPPPAPVVPSGPVAPGRWWRGPRA